MRLQRILTSLRDPRYHELDRVSSYLGKVGADASRCALILDFDGTIAPMQVNPVLVSPAPGAIEVLEKLSLKLGLLGVVSGRPLAFLARQLPSALLSRLRLAGSYGVEIGGDSAREKRAHHGQLGLREAFVQAKSRLPEGLDLEDKPYSFTLHYRRSPELEVMARDFARAICEEYALYPLFAKSAIELFPSPPPSKSAVVLAWSEKFSAVCYVGDDLADIEPMEAIAGLRSTGKTTLTVGVVGDDTPPGIREASDLCLSSPDEVVGWLLELDERSGLTLTE